MSFANPSGSGNVNLKRSQTNAADLGLRLSAVQHFVNERQRFDASTNSLNAMAARSRSNIAALNWNFGESELYTGQQRVPNTSNLSRATSFYHRDQIQSARSMGFLGPPCNKDLSRPLHVDCSVEYDLGNQPCHQLLLLGGRVVVLQPVTITTSINNSKCFTNNSRSLILNSRNRLLPNPNIALRDTQAFLLEVG